jgi:Protein of unknown function (DUF4235)
VNTTKLAYKPVGLVLGMVAGAVSGLVFHRLWRAISGNDETPTATDEDRGWGEVLAAAAMQGIIFAVIKAAVDRGGAQGVRKLTGRWPA